MYYTNFNHSIVIFLTIVAATFQCKTLLAQNTDTREANHLSALDIDGATLDHNTCTDNLPLRINVTEKKSQQKHQQTTSVNEPLFHKKNGNLYDPQDNQYDIDDAVSETDETSLSDAMLKAISRAHSIRTYHLDISSYRKSARTVGDAVFIDNQNVAHVKRCQRHLNLYARLLDRAKHVNFTQRIPRQAILLADSYGRPESGIQSGNSFWLGSYLQCSQFSVDSPLKINSQYCLVSGHAPGWNRKDTKNTIRLGVCLPETCSNSMLEDHFRAQVYSMASVHLTPPYNELEMTNIYCLPHVTSEIRQFSWSSIGFLSVIGAFVVTCAVATVFDSSPLKDDANQLGNNERNLKTIIIEGFSLTRNFHRITNTKTTRAPDGDSRFLSTINGIKVIGLLWIISAHTFLLGPITASNLISMDTHTQSFLASFYLSAHLVVDTFFALSGLLASYLLFKSNMSLMSTGKWIVATVHRYWRLTPLYLLAFWYAKSMGHLMNSGPFWDYMTAEKSPRLQCNNESWLVALLHWSDFKSPKDHCVPFAWFIANGIKFWMVTPIFVTMIAKSTVQGYKMTGLAIVANMALVFILALKSSVDVEAVIGFKPESADDVLNNMGEIYSRPYSRIGTYLIGLLAGHLLFLMETKQVELRLSVNANKIIWTLVTATFILLTFLVKFAQVMPKEGSSYIYMFCVCTALVRPLWATCTCWLIVAMALGQVPWLRNFLSSNVWKVLVRLSYSGYLVQGEILAVTTMGQTGAHSFRYSEMITGAIVMVVLTLVVSFFTTLLIEYPLIAIEELVFPKVAHKKSTDQREPCSLQGENCLDKNRTLGDSCKQKVL